MERAVSFHTYLLEDEPILRVVIKRILMELDLISQGPLIQMVHHIYNMRTKEPYNPLPSRPLRAGKSFWCLDGVLSFRHCY